MEFTEEQLHKFMRFQEAHAQARGVEAPKLNHEFAQANGLLREDIMFIVAKSAELEAAARSRGLIA